MFALTLNAKLVDRFLRTSQFREVLGRTVDSFGLERLADLRLLHSHCKPIGLFFTELNDDFNLSLILIQV